MEKYIYARALLYPRALLFGKIAPYKEKQVEFIVSTLGLGTEITSLKYYLTNSTNNSLAQKFIVNCFFF